jgi:hypothetical protein
MSKWANSKSQMGKWSSRVFGIQTAPRTSIGDLELAKSGARCLDRSQVGR